MNRGISFAGTESSPGGFRTSSHGSVENIPTIDFGSPSRSLDAEELRKRARDFERKLDLAIDSISEAMDTEYAYSKVKDAEEVLKQVCDVSLLAGVAVFSHFNFVPASRNK